MFALAREAPLPAPVAQAFLPARVYRRTHRRGPTASTHGRQDYLPHCGRTWPAGLPAPCSSLRNPGPVGQAFLPLPGKHPCRPQWRRHSCLRGCTGRPIGGDPRPARTADKIVCPTAGGHGVLDRLPRRNFRKIVLAPQAGFLPGGRSRVRIFGVFYRRRLPHWDPGGKIIFITWRLHPSVPARTLRNPAIASIVGEAIEHGAVRLRRYQACMDHNARARASASPSLYLLGGHHAIAEGLVGMCGQSAPGPHR